MKIQELQRSSFLCLICFMALIPGLTAQSDSLSEGAFDFWLGSWQLEWKNQEGATVRGQNNVIKILNGKVIQENFRSPDGFEGKSWSVYNPSSGEWRQSWVDNQSGYLDFKGGRQGDTLIFAMAPSQTDSSYLERRMIFYDIRPDDFTWDWQSRQTPTGDWQLKWRILYRRKM